MFDATSLIPCNAATTKQSFVTHFSLKIMEAELMLRSRQILMNPLILGLLHGLTLAYV